MHAACFFADAVDSLFEAIGPLPCVTTGVDKAAELYIAAYFIIAFWRAYETTFFGALWRARIVSVLYLVAVMAAVLSVAIPLIFGPAS